MKKPFRLLCVLILWLGVALSPISAQAFKNPVEAYGELQTEGAYIIGSKVGIPVQVKGMSFFWNQWGGENQWNAGVVGKMVDEWNCEVLRIAYSTTSGGKRADANAGNAVIDECIKRGIYVILDFHSHFAENEFDEAKEFFTSLAQRYGQYDNVIFEIYNEPKSGYADHWPTIKSYAERIIPVIRQYSDNLILVGTPFFSIFLSEPTKNPITSSSNIAYVFHFYALSHHLPGDGLPTWEYDQMKPGFGKIPVFCTEYGTTHSDGGRSTGSIDTNSTNKWFALMDQYKISSCNWSIHSDSQASAIWGNSSGSGSFIQGMLNNWHKVAPWVTGDLKPKPLVANSGPDKMVILPKSNTILLATQTGGKQPYTYTWKQISGPNSATITNGTQSSATLSNLVAGDYLFEVTVGCPNDNSTDQVAVKVYADGVVPDGMIDNFADNDLINVWRGDWGTYNDIDSKGTTDITPSAQLVTNGSAKATYTMHKAGNTYEPYCGVRVNLKEDKTAYNITGCKYITYDYKGDAHQFRIEQSNVTDGAFYYIDVPAAADWTSVTLEIAKFQQAGWTKLPLALDITIVKSLSWQTSKADGQTGSLELDNLACYGATPPVKPTPDPKFTSATNSLANSSQIVATFDKALATINASDKNSFTFKVSGSTRTIESISGSGSNITFNLSGAVLEDEVITLSYIKGQIKNTLGDLMEDFTNKSVTNLLKSTPAIGRLLADAEGDGKTIFGTSWEIATAGANANSATANPLELVTDGADDTQRSAKMTYTLANDSWQVANLGFYLSTNKTAYDLSSATGIGFWHKGSGSKMVIHLSSNSSDNLHKATVAAHSQWTWVELAWNQFTQESGWGTIVTLDPKLITKMKWEVNAAGTNGTLQVDQVWALGMAELSIKKSLNTKIAQAEAIISTGVFGSEAGNYGTGAKTTLTNAIDAAKIVSSNLAATQTEVDLATTNIAKTLFDIEKARLDVAISVSTAYMNSVKSTPAVDAAKITFSAILQNANTVISSATNIDLITAETNKVVNGLVAFKATATSLFSQPAQKVQSRVYPNPCSGITFVETEDFNSESIAVFNCLGENVTQLIEAINIMPGNWSIDLSALPNGLYFIKTDKSCAKVQKAN